MFNILFSYEDEDIGRFSNLYQCTITYYVQKQPPEVFYKKGVLRNFAKFTGKHLCHSLFFNKVARLRYATLLKRDSGTTEDKNEKNRHFKGIIPKQSGVVSQKTSSGGILSSQEQTKQINVLGHCILAFIRGKWVRATNLQIYALHEKCPYSELFWFAFSHIRTEYGPE